PHLTAKPLEHGDVGMIVQSADKDTERFRVLGYGAKVLQIDTVGYGMHHLRIAKLSIEISFGLADECHGIESCRQFALQLPESASLYAIEPRAQHTTVGRVINPLLTIDIHQIDDTRHPAQLGQVEVRRHAGGR